MIEYKSISNPNKEETLKLYTSVGWTNYTKNIDILLKGIQYSLCTIGAFEGERLIGLVRVVGDGHTIIYIQDLLVHPVYQQNGVGQELIKIILTRYDSVRQKVLLTDTNKRLDKFYQKTGFSPSLNLNLTCYVRLDS